MKYVEIVFGITLVALGLYASISDIKIGIIKNKVLLYFSIVAVLLNVIYYAVFVQDIARDFLYNILFIVLISVVLYLSRIWAAGDVKLVLVMTLLIPARLYIPINSHIITLFIAICIAFILGYFYLLSIGCYSIISGKVKTSWKKVFYGFKQWLFSYIIVILYTIPISVLYGKLISNFIIVDSIIVIISFSLLAIVISKIKALRNRIVLPITFAADVILCIAFKVLPFSTNYYLYLIAAVLVIIQQIVTANNYEEIFAKDIKPGMILSTSSAFLVMQAGIGIDKKTKEDQGSRLDAKEAERIKNWGIGTTIKVSIVKKIPFAIFIFLGYLIYNIIGVLMTWK